VHEYFALALGAAAACPPTTVLWSSGQQQGAAAEARCVWVCVCGGGGEVVSSGIHEWAQCMTTVVVLVSAITNSDWV
jgi:hypothetical protein